MFTNVNNGGEDMVDKILKMNISEEDSQKAQEIVDIIRQRRVM